MHLCLGGQVRVLFSTTAGAGHFGPMIPVARACVDSGHDVAVAAPASFADHVREAGFVHLTFPDAPPDVMAAVFGRVPDLSREEGNALVIAEVFGRLDAQAALPTMLQIVSDWRPDLVVRDPAEFAAAAAAERAGVPQGQVAISLGHLFEAFAAILDEPLRELEALAGLATHRGSDVLLSTPTLTSVPASLDGPEDSGGGRQVWRYRVPVQSSGPAVPGQWGDPEHPLLYVSFGSIAGALRRFDEVYRQVLEGLADLPVRVLMTTGATLDPASLGPAPANACVRSWWPQEAAMPETALIIGHGGFGTTMTAVRAGVPQIVIPLFSSDQFVNAERIHAAGAGLQLPRGLDDVASVPAAVEDVLSGAHYAAAARNLAGEIAALPDVSTTVRVLEALAD